MNAIKWIVVIVLCLGLSSGARYFLTGTYVPNWARVITPYPPAPAFDPQVLQATIGQPSIITLLSPTIFQLMVHDVTQQDLWTAVERAQTVTVAKLHKLSIIKGNKPRRYHLDLIFHRAADL
jgi:hypothetical protein